MLCSSMAYDEMLGICDFLWDGYDHPCERYEIGSHDPVIPFTVFSVLSNSSSSTNTVGSTEDGVHWNSNYFLGITTIFVIMLLLQIVLIPAVLNAIFVPYGQLATILSTLQQWYERRGPRWANWTLQDFGLAADILCVGVFQLSSLIHSSLKVYSSSGYSNSAALGTVADVFGWVALLAIGIPTILLIAVAGGCSTVNRRVLVSRSLNVTIATLQVIISLAEKMAKHRFLSVGIFPLVLILIDTGNRFVDLVRSVSDRQPTQQQPDPTTASTGEPGRAATQLGGTASSSHPPKQ